MRILSNFIVLLTLLFFVGVVDDAAALPTTPLSARTKCTVDCYAKCAKAGETKAVYCDCPLHNAEAIITQCHTIGIEENTIDRALPAETIYKNARTIWVRVNAFQNSFIYVFEFAFLDSDYPQWNFAGASSSPEITFNIPDPCHDYQFRVIAVLNANVTPQFVVLKAQHIPVKLPPFEVQPDSIQLDTPKESSNGQSIKVSISWHHPIGYDAEDIYGYESPTAYPIRCMTPEGHISQPRVVRVLYVPNPIIILNMKVLKELVEGGARMHLHIPVDVLQERCQIYMEVKIVPKCVRIDSHNLQVSVELDCQKFQNLRYCRKEMSPQCTDIVDLWGQEHGMVTVVWQPPNTMRVFHRDSSSFIKGKHEGKLTEDIETSVTTPLYYSLNFGETQLQDYGPLTQFRIAEVREIRVPGNITSTEIGPLRAGLRYGIQICGIYSSDMSQSPFHIIPVIGFLCNTCHRLHKDSNCLECTKIDEMKANRKNYKAHSENSRAHASTLNRVDANADCRQDGHVIFGAHSINYIASNTAALNILTSNNTNVTGSSLQARYNSTPEVISNQVETRTLLSLPFNELAALDPISTLSEPSSIEDITFNDRVDVFNPLQRHSKTISTSRIIKMDKTMMRPSEEPDISPLLQMNSSDLHEDTSTEILLVQGQERKPFVASSALFTFSSSAIPIISTDNLNGIDAVTTTTISAIFDAVEAITTSFVIQQKAENLSNQNKPFTTTSSSVSTTIAKTKGTLPESKKIKVGTESELRLNQAKNYYQKQRTRIEDNFAAAGHHVGTPFTIINEHNGQRRHNSNVVGKVEFVTISSSTNVNETNRSVNDSDRFRVKERKTNQPCRLAGGLTCEFGCADDGLRCLCFDQDQKNEENNCIRGLFCPHLTDVHADYNRVDHAVALYSVELANIIEKSKSYDKLLLEFGELQHRSHENHTSECLRYGPKNNEFRVISINKLVNSSLLFDNSHPYRFRLNKIRLLVESYGINVCLLQSKNMLRMFDNLTDENDGITINEKLKYAYRSSRLSRVKVRHIIPKNQLNERLEDTFTSSTNTQSQKSFEATSSVTSQQRAQSLSVQRFIVFLGPTFFILGMFGVVLLCLKVIRQHRRRRLSRYASASLKCDTVSRRREAAEAALGGASISVPLFTSSTFNAPFGVTTTPISCPSNFQTSIHPSQANYVPQYNAYGCRQLQPTGPSYSMSFGRADAAEAGTSTINTTIGKQLFQENDETSQRLNLNFSNSSNNNNNSKNNISGGANDNNRHYSNRNVHF